jgi:hypothetical protein
LFTAGVGSLLTFDTDPTLAANSATRFSSQGAVKTYVDNAVDGLKFAIDVVAASTANVNIASAPASLDTVSLTNGDRVLLKNQTTASQNGPYIFNGAGSALTRATDGNTGTKLVSKTFPVRGGTANQDTWWTITNDSITVGSTAITFTQTGGAGTYSAGTGLSLAGNQFSIDSTVATLAGVQALTNKTLTAPVISSIELGNATDTTISRVSAGVIAVEGATIPTESTGTWTPVITFATPGNLSITSYTLQIGTYIKHGKLVTVTFSILTGVGAFTHTTASGDLTLTGLPFTVATAGLWRGALQFGGIAKAGYTNFTVAAINSTTTMIVTASASASAISNVAAADMPSGGRPALQGSITYWTD